jgi:hypothetical protein
MADDGGAEFAFGVRRRAQSAQHGSDQPAVVPFFFFDEADAGAIFRIGDGSPVSSIGQSSPE